MCRGVMPFDAAKAALRTHREYVFPQRSARPFWPSQLFDRKKPGMIGLTKALAQEGAPSWHYCKCSCGLGTSETELLQARDPDANSDAEGRDSRR